jgi:hypothetical protein
MNETIETQTKDKFLVDSCIDFLIIFSNLKIKRYLKLKSTQLKRIFILMEYPHVFCAKKILDILLNLSQSNHYGKIEFDEKLCDIEEFIKDLKSKYPIHAEMLNKINKNLKEKSIIDRLGSFREIYDRNGDIAHLIGLQTFFDDLLFIAAVLNGDHSDIEYFYLDCFKRYDSFKIFSKVLEKTFKDISLFYENDDIVDVKIYQLRDLLEIMSKFVQGSFLFNEYLLKNGIFKMIVNLLSDHGLLEFLFDAHIKIVCKVICIFYCISKTTYYLNKEFIQNFVDSFEVLRKTRDFLEDLTSENKGRPRNVTEKPVLRSFLVGLAFLQQKFNPKEHLISMNQYVGLAKGGFVRSLFKEVSSEYLKISSEIRWEFINEFNQKETQIVSKLIVPSNISTGINVLNTYTVVYTLNNIRVIFSLSNETKELAYENSKNFLKSIIYYGFDIEKILALKCLEEYCTVENVKKDLTSDHGLFKYLQKLAQMCVKQDDEQMKSRLKKTIDLYLESFENSL